MAVLDVRILPMLQDNYTYLLQCRQTGATAVVDAPAAKPVIKRLAEEGLKLDFILNTHHHYDHVGGNEGLLKAFPDAHVLCGNKDLTRIACAGRGLEDGDRVTVGECQAEVLFIPGHTLGHIAYYFPASRALFCGDTLFSAGCGRLFEGTPEQMNRSLKRLAALPGDTLVYCGHEYTEANLKFAAWVEPRNEAIGRRAAEVRKLRSRGEPSLPSTISVELATNPFLRVDESGIRETAAAHGWTAAKGSDEAFAVIRSLKDVF